MPYAILSRHNLLRRSVVVNERIVLKYDIYAKKMLGELELEGPEIRTACLYSST
jgi:hypothetical protein